MLGKLIYRVIQLLYEGDLYFWKYLSRRWSLILTTLVHRCWAGFQFCSELSGYIHFPFSCVYDREWSHRYIIILFHTVPCLPLGLQRLTPIRTYPLTRPFWIIYPFNYTQIPSWAQSRFRSDLSSGPTTNLAVHRSNHDTTRNGYDSNRVNSVNFGSILNIGNFRRKVPSFY